MQDAGAATAAGGTVVPSGVLDVSAAARSAFSDLAARTGLDQWWLVRRRGEEQVVLADLAGAGARSATVPWRSGVPAAALDSGAPPVAARVADVPAYADACAASGLRAGALLVVPVRSAEGTAVGALCSASERPRPDLAAHLPGVRAAADLLGLLLEQALLLDDVVRRAERAEAAAHTDPLTGLGNRRAWDAAVVAEEDRAARHGTPTAVVVLDLDGLKQLNDTAGHDAGDDVLRQAGAALRAQVRAQDAVVRLGGDEFGVLLPDTEREVADAVAARVRSALAQAGVGVSCGVGTRTGQDGLLGAWRAADEAMYADKRARRRRGGGGLSSSGAWGQRPAPATAAAGRVPAAVPVTTAAERGVDALLEVARAQLGADVAFISVFEGGQRRFRNVVSRVRVPFSAGASEPRDGTVCDLLVRGEVPGAVPDLSASPLADHPDVRALSIGAHVGVELRRADGTTYGTLCAYSQRPDPQLRPRDAESLAALGRAVMGLVEVEDASEATARAVRARLEDLDGQGGLRTLFRPVLSLADGALVGHDAEAHFPHGTPPRGTWFSEARAVGASEPLETAALHDALEASRDLDGWLLVGASAPTVTAPAFTRRMASADPSRLVLQVLGDVEPSALRCLRAALAPLRRDGLRLALAAAGTARNGGDHVLALEPELVGVHRRVVAGVAGSRSQQALVNGLLSFSATLGAQLLARGPASADDLAWLRGAGVPLAHGGPAAAPEPAPGHVGAT